MLNKISSSFVSSGSARSSWPSGLGANTRPHHSPTRNSAAAAKPCAAAVMQQRRSDLPHIPSTGIQRSYRNQPNHRKLLPEKTILKDKASGF